MLENVAAKWTVLKVLSIWSFGFLWNYEAVMLL